MQNYLSPDERSQLAYLIDQYKILHQTIVYGNTSQGLNNIVSPIVRKLKASTILDYGCGKSKLIDMLQLDYPVKRLRYDPAIAEYSHIDQQKVDIVICTGVLEHIPMFGLFSILQDIKSFSNQVIFLVGTKKAKRKLPDGSNAHITIMNESEWLETIGVVFEGVHAYCSILPRRKKCFIFLTF